MSVQQLLLGASGASGYNIDRSLRFRASASANLNRTPASAGNRKAWTWSGWVKRGALGGTAAFFAGSDGAASSDAIYFSSDSLAYFQAAVGAVRVSTAVYRDPSAWYHIVAVSDSANATAQNRFRFYVNGVEVTAWSTNATITQNRDGFINANTLQRIGCNTGLTQFFDGYLAEVNFIDGQALTPSSFGSTNALTGVWQPAPYTGTYGTNGFYLKFTSNSTAAALGTDFSGNSNTWTVNNISVTAGVTYDSMTDVPTLTNATTANYAVLNPLSRDFGDGSASVSTLPSDGNLRILFDSTSWNGYRSSIAVNSGKWYVEMDTTAGGSTPANSRLGFLDINTAVNTSAGVAEISPTSAGQTVAIALDLNAGSYTTYRANVVVATGSVTLGNTYCFRVRLGNAPNAFANFGQRPFAFSPPTGYVALNTFNLP